MGEQFVGAAQVGADHHRAVVDGQQPPGVRDGDLVDVGVDHPRVGRDLADDLVHVALGGQAGADVEELAYALLGGEPDGPAQEVTVGLGGDAGVRKDRQDLLGGGPVGGEVVAATQEVVVHPGHVGPLLGVGRRGHRKLPSLDDVAPACLAPAATLR